jgi:hypothetical protein
MTMWQAVLGLIVGAAACMVGAAIWGAGYKAGVEEEKKRQKEKNDVPH